MKRLLVTLACMFSFLTLQAADITAITNAFKEGNAAALASLMDKEVDLTLPEVSKKYDGTEVIKLLNTFFQSNKPSGFTLLHHADRNDSGFFVGKLLTNGKEFRVNVTYRAEGDKAIIQSVRVE